MLNGWYELGCWSVGVERDKKLFIMQLASWRRQRGRGGLLLNKHVWQNVEYFIELLPLLLLPLMTFPHTHTHAHIFSIYEQLNAHLISLQEGNYSRQSVCVKFYCLEARVNDYFPRKKRRNWDQYFDYFNVNKQFFPIRIPFSSSLLIRGRIMLCA
jgi:hypothetical protein